MYSFDHLLTTVMKEEGFFMQLQFKLSVQSEFYNFVTQLPMKENCFLNFHYKIKLNNN